MLARYFTWVPVCPEMEVGMGVPREPIRLVGDAAAPRLMGVTSGTDHTERMSEFARRRVDELRRRGLCGYILKRASPSCGLERVKVHAGDGPPARTGTGLFARALTDALPLLPVEEEGRLNDAHLRDNFITRVFAYRRLAALRESEPRPAAVVEFHTAHKYLLLAHSPAAYARLGRLVAAIARPPARGGSTRYGEGFMRGARDARDDQEARQRPAAHHGLLQDAARGRRRSASCSGSSATTRPGSCRWWCRSR